MNEAIRGSGLDAEFGGEGEPSSGVLGQDVGKGEEVGKEEAWRRG